MELAVALDELVVGEVGGRSRRDDPLELGRLRRRPALRRQGGRLGSTASRTSTSSGTA
jgi:hypothetical protein